MHNICITSSPGHYYSLLEFIAQEKVAPEDTDLIMFRFERDLQSLVFFEKYVAKGGWRSVKLLLFWNLRGNKVKGIRNLVNYLRYIRRFQGVKFNQFIVVQHDTPYARHLLNSVQYEELVSPDEGNAVYRLVEERRQRLAGTRPPKAPKLYRLLNFKLQEPKHITWFSAFDVTPPECDKLLPIKFIYSRSQIANKAHDENLVIVIGSPYVEDGLLSKEYYDYLLKQLKEAYLGKHVVYIPHRRETQENLNYIHQHFGFKVERPNMPIEMYFIWHSPLPFAVVGFYSTALTNIYHAFDGALRCIAWKFDLNEFRRPEMRDNLLLIYKDMEELGIEVVVV